MIDREAFDNIQKHITRLKSESKVLLDQASRAGEAPESIAASVPNLIAPHAFEVARTADMKAEVFGPVLQVVRWGTGDTSNPEDVIDQINALGYGLTLGIQTRIDSRAQALAEAAHVGNIYIYINRNMISRVKVSPATFAKHSSSAPAPRLGSKGPVMTWLAIGTARTSPCLRSTSYSTSAAEWPHEACVLSDVTRHSFASEGVGESTLRGNQLLKHGANMNFYIPIFVSRVLMIAAVGSCTFSANAQRVLGDPKDALVVKQINRVYAAMDRLAPLQIAGCWLTPHVSPLNEVSVSESLRSRLSTERADAAPPLSNVQPGDLPASVDGQVIKQDGTSNRAAVAKARQGPFYQLLSSGRSFVETYKDSHGKEISITNPVRLVCTASDIWISDAQSEGAASRDKFLGLRISASRLALLDDDQLLAFLAWNHAFMALRHETYADFVSIFTRNAYGSGEDYLYGSGAHEKIDWVTLRTLRALNANLKAYGTMLTAIEVFDKSAGLFNWGDKQFISVKSGRSPFGGEDKQARLAAWVKLLEQDSHATAPGTLKLLNAMLAWPTWTGRTLPLDRFQTVGEALQPLLGEAQAKSVAERYLSTFDWEKLAADKPIAGHMGGKATHPGFHMLYAHHPTHRLIWLSRRTPSDSDGGICTLPSDCSILVVGAHVVARPSPVWAQELQAAPGGYTLEELN